MKLYSLDILFLPTFSHLSNACELQWQSLVLVPSSFLYCYFHYAMCYDYYIHGGLYASSFHQKSYILVVNRLLMTFWVKIDGLLKIFFSMRQTRHQNSKSLIFLNLTDLEFSYYRAQSLSKKRKVFNYARNLKNLWGIFIEVLRPCHDQGKSQPTSQNRG